MKAGDFHNMDGHGSMACENGRMMKVYGDKERGFDGKMV